MSGVRLSNPSLRSVTLGLLEYCHKNDWAGYDPYDILNSRLLECLPFFNQRLIRIALTQITKRSPLNLRPLLLVPQTKNPKALALFLTAVRNLVRQKLLGGSRLVDMLAEELMTSRSRGTGRLAWGYSFPWQTRTEVVPRAFPNLVCTTFAAHALLDAFELTHKTEYLSSAVEGADFIIDDLFWEGSWTVAGFGYPLPSMRSQIHNANFLGASLLGRIHLKTGNPRYLGPALKAARYSLSRQNPDGSWYYGEEPFQQWIDNFHTGYNLLALRGLGDSLRTTEFDAAICKGFVFYKNHFFRSDGAPRYYHDRDFPVDIHCLAQSLLTLVGLKDLDSQSIPLASAVLQWGLRHMWDTRGYFFYQVHPAYTNKISYMRWSQAWMLLALSRLIEEGLA